MDPIVERPEKDEAVDPSMERRREVRIDTRNLVSVARFDGWGFLTGLTLGRTLDLSRDGMRLELTHGLPPRSTISLSVALGNRIVNAHGRVVYEDAPEAENPSLGIQFTDLSPEGYEALSEFIGLRQ